MKPVFILTGGGTAGHVVPNLALASYLSARFDLHYVGSDDGMERRLVENAGIPFHAVPCVKLDRSKKLANVAVPFRLLKARAAAGKLLKELQPVGIFSKGGYVALPVVLAAKRIPVFIHESDYSLGLANKLCVKKAKTVFTSFPSATDGLDNAVCCGSPIRKELYFGDAERARALCNLRAPLPYLLIVGGSSGAKAINDCVYSVVGTLAQQYNVIHITGAKNERSPVSHPNYFSLGYTDRIADFLALADVVVTRGGSGVLFEIAAIRKPALIIPLPKGASRGDQVLNAGYFASRGYAAVLDQADMTGGALTQAVNDLYGNRDVYIGNLRAGSFDGTRKIVAAIEQAIPTT
ncbi:MAG: UDP-N-acetylglucosamine--N-acetylmuramyl-(pentapeptide) pyrophosphoryl-undecaprenol N-acetylglucosamine transferase [Clostridia bacterium]|jgi:UDP-N-acetylglucosamine--N-acetylmuramyl-(pentapeptide) pyrophosphoryl-undecaprenol N-acetylglucosamine transferase|nr:UDP-N-acetylglucosamine--N-acetylmuramyl-(pentapeptide) pyrophosphoryl-undecaprenol N-acetylglucosamine transferase [Clostridia bacterium]